jgi:hypothetical protein
VLKRILIVVFALMTIHGSPVSGENETFNFAVVADSRGKNPEVPVNVPVLSRVFRDMNAFAPEFCLFPGDLVFGGFVDNEELKRQLRIWINTAADFNRPIYPAPGNHEMRHGPSREDAWNQMFPGLPSNGPIAGPKVGNYFFDYRGSRFISVLADYEDGRVGIDQKWLNHVLESSAGSRHIFVMGHHPMQQLGGAEGEFWRSLRRHHVDAYFCGHWHLYNRSQPGGTGTWQIILGTAGAPPISYFPTWIMNGTTRFGKYGFGIIKVNGSSVEATFYSNIEGQEKYIHPLDNFVVSDSEAHQGTHTYSELKDTILELLTRGSADNSAPTSERK